MNKDFIIGLSSGLVAGAVLAGGGVFMYLTRKHEAEFEDRIDEAANALAESISMDYARFYADYQPKPDLEELIETGDDGETFASRLVKQTKAERDAIIETMDYNGTKEDPEDIQTQESNIFEDEDARVIARLSIVDQNKPYLITVEEFMDDYNGFGKMTLTYFEEDGILIEEVQQSIIENESLIGSEVLSGFGRDPQDKNTIHVRNEQFEADFEVTRDPRSYSEVIAGFKEPEEKPHVRKPRREDDDR